MHNVQLLNVVDLLSPTHGFSQSWLYQWQYQSQSWKRAAKGEKQLYHFSWFCCYSSFCCLAHLSCSAWTDCSSAVTSGSQAEENDPQLLLPTVLCCPQSPRSTYNRALDPENPISLSHCPPEHTVVALLQPFQAHLQCLQPLLFASPSGSPSTRSLARSEHLCGHKGGSRGY